MATPNELPLFFSGQYLGAQELNALSDYFRFRSARHSLAVNSWGIAAGLDLTEKKAVDGSVEIYLQPGYCFDGYGRPVAVMDPYKISGESFLEETTGLVPVWLKYSENGSKQVRSGFKVCECDEAFQRISETFEVVVGRRDAVSERQSGIDVAGLAVDDARDALRALDGEGPLICDGSVPFQSFPDVSDGSFWLIPLGYVAWQAGSPGKFAERTGEQLRLSRGFRRYCGVIADTIHAADGVIRLRERRTKTDGSLENDKICQAFRIEEDDFDVALGDVEFEDLVWIEGNLRIEGNARLFGTRLEFRDGEGEDQGVPLYFRRSDEEGLAKDSQDLILALGMETNAENNNRLMIGTEKDDGSFAFKTVVTDGGKIGIGVEKPHDYAGGADDLVIGGGTDQGITLASTSTGNIRFADGTDKNSNEQGRITYDHSVDKLVFGVDGVDRIWLTDQGRMGIGTEDPVAGLHIVTGSDVSLADHSGFLVIGEIDALNIAIDNNEIQARDKGDTSTLYFQAEGGDLVYNQHQGQSQRIALKEQGRIGVGIDNPLCPLQIVNGELATLDDDSGYLLLGSVSGTNLVMDNNEIQVRNSGSVSTLYLQAKGGDVRLAGQVWVKSNNRVGIGTSSPSDELEVRGTIRLGDGGNLYAPGGVTNLRVIAGRVELNGVKNFGSGYVSSKNSAGHYTIGFIDSFPSAPVVTVTPIEGSADDNLPTVHDVDGSGFKVRFKDTTPGDEGDYHDTAFGFIVMGQR